MKTDWVDDLNAVFIPKNDWKALDPTEFQDLGHTDNKKEQKANDSVSLTEAISNAVTFCETNGIAHTDDAVKDKFLRWGFGKTEWEGKIRKTLNKESKKSNTTKSYRKNVY